MKEMKEMKYILRRKDLREVLDAHKEFMGMRFHELLKQGVDISKLTYGQMGKITEEFIDTMIQSFPADTMLDKIDDLLKQCGMPTTMEQLDQKRSEE